MSRKVANGRQLYQIGELLSEVGILCDKYKKYEDKDTSYPSGPNTGSFRASSSGKLSYGLKSPDGKYDTAEVINIFIGTNMKGDYFQEIFDSVKELCRECSVDGTLFWAHKKEGTNYNSVMITMHESGNDADIIISPDQKNEIKEKSKEYSDYYYSE